MSYMARVAATASSGLPPTKRTMAGAAPMAIPPMPMVSVMVESPMSRLASSGPNPGRYSPSIGRAGEPAVAGAGQADPELGAVAGHGGDDRGAGRAGGRVGGGLAGGHGQVEEEMVVAGDELGRGDHVGGGLLHGQQGRQQSSQQQRGAGPVAVVALVAHLQRLGDQGAQVERLG